MGIERKELIIKEIQYWKESKLLPAQYCDFLLMIYSHGEGLDHSNQKQQGRLWFYIDFLFLLLFIPISIYLILWMDISLFMSLALIVGVLAIAIIHVVYYKRINSIVVHLPIILILLVGLTGTISLGKVLDLQLNYYLIVFFHCLLWISLGFWNKWIYLMVSGLVGLLILLVNLFI
ncbi:hypothetical protein [Piscibacillus halophilus]|uniref:hypothetical protein n=1 Tax=Piscibacillus halophilus TaxID=571933 RepID=UPI00158856EA|nr:hypothetical protein [Piscibacillus halophilus]